MGNGTCSLADCTGSRFRERLCSTHLAEVRAARGDLCSQCDRPRFSDSLCGGCYTKRQRELTPRGDRSAEGRMYLERKRAELGEAEFKRRDAMRKRRARGLPAGAPYFPKGQTPQKPEPCRALVGPVEPTTCLVPDSHPSRKKAIGTWYSYFVSGPCVWCEETFTAPSASPETRPKYCSKTCASARAKGLGSFRFNPSPRLRRAIYERDGWTCQLCFGPVDPELHYLDDWAGSLDHIIPQSHTLIPDHSEGNLRLVHRWCNSVRSDGRGDWIFDEVA